MKLIEIQRKLLCGIALAREVQQLIESPTAELLAERNRLRKILRELLDAVNHHETVQATSCGDKLEAARYRDTEARQSARIVLAEGGAK